MSAESEWDEDEQRELHALFGEEAGALVVGPSPVASVMRGGKVLRRRRRAAWGGSVAVLAALPIAAVAVFGGAGTGARPGGEAAAGVKQTPVATTTTTAYESTASTAADQIVVLGSGTYGGKTWQLIRDRYVVDAKYLAQVNRSSGIWQVPRLPLSQEGKPGVASCEFVTVQFSTGEPAQFLPGAQNAAGSGGWCGVPQTGQTQDGFAVGGYRYGRFSPQAPGLPADGLAIITAVAPGVATVSVEPSVGVKLGPAPVFHFADEKVGYFATVIGIPGLSADPGMKFTNRLTYYNANGSVVGGLGLNDSGGSSGPTLTVPLTPPPAAARTSPKGP